MAINNGKGSAGFDAAADEIESGEEIGEGVADEGLGEEGFGLGGEEVEVEVADAADERISLEVKELGEEGGGDGAGDVEVEFSEEGDEAGGVGGEVGGGGGAGGGKRGGLGGAPAGLAEVQAATPLTCQAKR